MSKPGQWLRDGGLWAFLLTVGAGYFTVLVQPPARFTPASLAAFLALGLVFALLGTVEVLRHPAWPWPWVHWAYLAAQLPLAAIILYLSQYAAFIAIILFPLVSQAFATLPRRQALLASALVLAAGAVPIALLTGWRTAVLNVPILLAGIVFVAVFTEVAQREHAARGEIERLATELRTANQQLRLYSAQVEELATAKERNRLAREIHDSLGHYLTVINVQLEAAQAVLESSPARARDALAKAQALAQEGLADVRRSVAALRAAPTGDRPLPEAVGLLADEARAAGIVTHYQVLGTPRALPPQTELTLYRAAQEALTNVRKHARASRADLRLDYARPDCVRLMVQDNGVGAREPAGGFGLLGVRERVQLLGGRVTIETAAGEGFRLEIETPG